MTNPNFIDFMHSKYLWVSEGTGILCMHAIRNHCPTDIIGSMILIPAQRFLSEQEKKCENEKLARESVRVAEEKFEAKRMKLIKNINLIDREIEETKTNTELGIAIPSLRIVKNYVSNIFKLEYFIL